MTTKLLLRSFAGGEITPELNGRIDLGKFQTGLGLARNFITLPHGPAARRPGTRFIIEAKDSTHKVRLIPFQFSADQTAVLEFGHQYIRFHIDGGTLLEGAVAIDSITGATVTATAHGFSTGDWVYIGARFHKITVTGANTFTTADFWGSASAADGPTCARVYTLASPYDEADLFKLGYAQDANVLTITHPAHAVRELSRLGATNWALTVVDFAPPTGAPSSVLVTPTSPASGVATQSSYVVTAVQADGVTESLPSAVASASNDLTKQGNYNTVSWSGVAGAVRYNVYKLRGGVYGYIGQIIPDTTLSTVIASISRGFLSTISVTTSSAHGITYAPYKRIYVSDTGVPSLDGTWWLTAVPTATTLTLHYPYGGMPASASTGKITDVSSSSALSVKDDNVLPDTTTPPPDDLITLNKEQSDYPSCVTHHEQRRWFAGTDGKPQVLFCTRTGTTSNLTSSLPARDADALEIRIAATQYNRIRHLMALSDLIAFTAGGEFRIYAEGAPAITPNSVSVKPQGFSGAADVQPVVTSGSILYVQAQGAHVRELAYNWEANAYRSIDVSMFAPHRFNGHAITQLAYSRAPDQILWAVRDDGVLLAMTYVPDQQVFGWHMHETTGGAFESACVVSEGNEDVLYVVARRTIDERAVRYVERLNTRIFTALEDAYFVDCGLTYSGEPTDTVTGLWHLEGQEVQILADGAVATPATVTDGAVSVGFEASVIHVGLPIVSDLRTLPLTLEGMNAAGQGTLKNVTKAHLRVSSSSLVQAGPSFGRLRAYPPRAVSDNYGSPPGLRDGELTLTIDPVWSTDGAVCVRQAEPLPLTVASMTLEAQVGG